MGIPFNLQLGINLIDILLDAPLGKEQLFRNFPIPQAACHQLHDFIFSFRQRGKGCRTMRGKLLLPLFGCLSEPLDARKKGRLRQLFKRFFEKLLKRLS